MMRKIIWLFSMLLFLGLFSQPLIAQEGKKEDAKQEDDSNEPWERAALYLGAFFITSNSDLELGSGGANIKIDLETMKAN
jgi:hypothetical protein